MAVNNSPVQGPASPPPPPVPTPGSSLRSSDPAEMAMDRLIAGLSDLAVVFIVSLVFALLSLACNFIPFVGWIANVFIMMLSGLLCSAYLLLRDYNQLNIGNFADGRSPAKKWRGVAAVNGSGTPCSFQESALRNLPLALGAIAMVLTSPLGLIPVFGSMIQAGILVIVMFCQAMILLAEIYLVFNDPQGLRIGDKIAGTHVVRR